MTHIRSIIRIMDNSGVKKARCIRIYNKSQTKPGFFCSQLIASAIKIKRSKRKGIKKRINKGDLVRVLLITKPMLLFRFYNVHFKTNRFGGIVLNANGQPRGTRIKILLPREIKKLHIPRLVTISLGLF